MAGLFEYTPTQSTVQATTPRVQIAPKTSNAFKSLSGLVDTYQNFQLAEKQREAQLIQSETSLLRTEQAIEAEKKRVSKANADAKQKELDTANNIRATKQLADAEATYYAQLESARGDITLIDEAFRTYNTSTSNVYEGLNDTNKKALDAHYLETRNRISKEYRENLTKLGINQNRNDVIAMMPAFVAGDIDSRKVIFNQMKTQGVAFGETPKSFGDNFSKTLKHYLENTVDEIGMINNLDYKAVDNLDATVRDMYAIDPRSGDVTDDSVGYVNTLRGKLDTKLNSYINGAIETGNLDMLNKYMDIGIANERKTEIDKEIANAKYLSKVNNPTALAKQAAVDIVERSGGLVYFNALSPEVERQVKPIITKKLRGQLYSNDPDVNFISHYVDKAPDYIKPEFVAAVRWHLSNAKKKAMATQTPQEAFQVTAQEMQSIDRLLTIGKLLPTPELLQEVNTFKALALSGNVNNAEEAMAKIAEKGGVKNYSDDNEYIVNIKENVSDDLFVRARDSFEAYVASGVLNEDEALEIVTNSFSFTDVGDNSFEISVPAIKKLTDFGLSQTALETAFETELAESDLISDTERSYLEAVKAGTDVKMFISQGNLKFKNAEGSVATIILSNEELASFAQSANDRALAQIPDESVGIFRAADVITDKTSSYADVTYNQVMKPLFIEPWIERPAKAIANGLPSPSQWAESLKVFGADTNRLIDDVLFTDKSVTQSFKEYNKKQEVVEKILLSNLSPQARLEYRQHKENKSIPVDEAEIEDNPESLGDIITGGFQSIIDFFISKSEASTGNLKNAYNAETKEFDLDTFYSNIGTLGEGRHGYNSQTDTYKPMPTNDAAEAGKPDSEKTKDIGYGHKIQKSEMESGMIHGIRFYNTETKEFIPLTESEVRLILKRDMNTNLTQVLPTWNKRIAESKTGKTFNDINPQAQAVLTSLAYNVKGKSAKKWDRIFDNDGLYTTSMDADQIANFALELRRKDNKVNTKGMDNRVMKELVSAGLISSKAIYDKVKEQLPLHDEFDSFASTQF